MPRVIVLKALALWRRSYKYMVMSREILFMRHGKAANPGGVGDFDRPLTERGMRQARHVGAWLSANDALPDAVLSSPALRALQTAKEAVQAAGLDTDIIRTDTRLYFDTRTNLLAALAGATSVGSRLLVVGHNPWLEELVLEIAAEPVPHPGGNWYMKTGAMMRFDVTDLAPGAGKLLDHILPDERGD